jgi:transcriptional regulator with XRE-family HTH domain
MAMRSEKRTVSAEGPSTASGDVPAVVETDYPTNGIGRQLRAVRTKRGFTLAQVAAATKISKSFLSLLEVGKTDVTIGRLMRLVHFYGISVVDLLPDAAADSSEITVVRNGEWTLLDSPSEGIRDYLLTLDTNRVMLPLIGVFEPGGRNVELAEHEGEEFVYILEGRFAVHIAAQEPVILSKGDSMYFRADLPHAYANVSEGESRLLAVITPPHL